VPLLQAGELNAAMSAREAIMNAPDADLEADPVAGAELSMAGIFASTRSMLALGNDNEAAMARAWHPQIPLTGITGHCIRSRAFRLMRLTGH